MATSSIGCEFISLLDGAAVRRVRPPTARAQQPSLTPKRTIYGMRAFPVAGGPINYGTDVADAYRQIGNYVGGILKAVPPPDLPVLQPTSYALVINLKTAGARP
jgi:hypothetical protein